MAITQDASAPDAKFIGWAAVDNTAVEGNLQLISYQPKTFCEDDIEVKILYSGICGSDIHTISGGWHDMSAKWPQVVGHEIVGEVVRVGEDSGKRFKVGEVVGIGAQSDSCQQCEWCDDHKENYCAKGSTGTYNNTYKRQPAAIGQKTYGGYANNWRGPSRFAVPIPANLDLASAAPMLCAGGTVYAPLKQYGCGTTAKRVGVVGIGGLGHFAVLFAKAMGASVTAITHGKSKVADAKELGAEDVIVTGDDAEAAVQGKQRTLDLIISTSNDPNLPIGAYLKLLRPGGNLIFVGAPDGGVLPQFTYWPMIINNVHLGASFIASPSDLAEMLQFAGDKGIKPWIQKYPMDKVNQAVVDMHAGKARYRYVLVNEQNGAKL